MDERIPKLNYDGPIYVSKQEGLAKEIRNYITRHIRNMLVYHKDRTSNIDIGYAIVLDFYNFKLEDILAHAFFYLTLAWKFLKYDVVGMILFHIEIIFHSDIKPQSIVQLGSSSKLTDLQS